MLWFLLVLFLCTTWMLPFFGTEAIRMLKRFDGIIRADPATGDIEPHGARNLGQELFAMLDDNLPQTQNAPVTLNQQPNADGTPGPVPLTINTPLGGHAIDLNGGTFNLRKGAAIQGAPGSSITVPDLTVEGSMNLNGGFYLWNGVPLHFAGGGTTVFLGRVVSGTGDTYKVDLYGNGFKDADGADLPATVEGVTVRIPQIAVDETIPAGFVLPAVHRFGTGTKIRYESQPAIWIS